MRGRRSSVLLAPALALAVAVAACGGDGGDGDGGATPAAAPVIDPGDGGDYRPDLDPAAVVDVVDNPYLPLLPGSVWVYEGEDGGEIERVEVTVLPERREVMGIDAVVVRDTVTVDGVVVEDTRDWFTQDRDGNVWYLGEDVKNFEDGRLTDTDGSWEAGVDGALPGIVMPARPRVGHAYRQEFWAGEAEDLGEILRTGTAITVPAGDYDDVVVTRDWNPLEPAVVEEKHYAPGVGLVFEEHVRGGAGQVELISFTRG